MNFHEKAVSATGTPKARIKPCGGKALATSVRWRQQCAWLTQIVFYALPWVSWNGQQAVLFDLAAHKFYLFGLVLQSQDLSYLAISPVIFGLSLFLFTALAGSAWCDTVPPQAIHTRIFMWSECKMEGWGAAHPRQDQQRLRGPKAGLKIIKHLVYGGFALWTGVTFVRYFTSISAIGVSLSEFSPGFSLGFSLGFWVFLFAFATYGNAGSGGNEVSMKMSVAHNPVRI